MIVVTGSFIAKAEHLEEALALSLEHVQRSRTEQGCITHSVHRDAENPLRLFFFEEWESMVALKAHFKVPASIEFGNTIAALADSVEPLNLCDATRLNG